MTYWKYDYEQIATSRITFNLLLYESSFPRICRISTVLLSKSPLSEIIRNLDAFEIKFLDLPSLAALKNMAIMTILYFIMTHATNINECKTLCVNICKYNFT